METITKKETHVTYQQDPADFEEIAAFYCGPSEEMQDAYRYDHEELIRYFGGEDMWESNVDFHANSGCWLCGARFSHGVVFKYLPTGQHVAIGHTCGSYVGMSDKAAATKRRNQAQATKAKQERERAEAAAARWAEVLADDPELAEAIEVEHRIIADIAAKGAKWGSISEKQRAFVLKLAEEAKADPKPAIPDVPVPESGKTTIEGVVLTVKWQDNDFSYYGGSLKMLVEVETDAGNYRLWGTCPAAIDNTEKGDRIRFTASQVERSHKDEAFGFFKRPSKAEIIQLSPEHQARVDAEAAEVAASRKLAADLVGKQIEDNDMLRGRTGTITEARDAHQGGEVKVEYGNGSAQWYPAEWAEYRKIEEGS